MEAFYLLGDVQAWSFALSVFRGLLPRTESTLRHSPPVQGTQSAWLIDILKGSRGSLWLAGGLRVPVVLAQKAGGHAGPPEKVLCNRV